MRRICDITLIGFAVGILLLPASSISAEDLFRDQVAAIFQQKCLSCHNAVEQKGEFSLQTAKAANADGQIEPGDSAGSYLVELITPTDGKADMPKDADPLSTDEIGVIRKWIDDGAKWPDDFELTEPKVADLNWWSLRPLNRPRIPARWLARLREKPEIGTLEIRTPVDAFVQEKLSEQKLIASPVADRRTLVRRLYFDLTGLPPTPDEVEEFINDKEANAYERLVDRLLDSKQYGEHWARHWLDVAHYADTHGYDKDKLRPNAWPYRDYVIRSLNADKPYSRFVLEQIAGDALWPNTVDGITATGFIAAGPWDFIGHAEVSESKIDGRIARHLDRDDMVTSTMNTFCSVTVQCARCHNHKFDPVTQEHYYSLQSVFAALDRADRKFDADPQIASRRAELQLRNSELETKKNKLDAELKAAAGERLSEIDTRLAALEKEKNADSNARPEFGYHSTIEQDENTTKWVQIDLGKPTSIDEIIFVGCHDDFNGIGHGFGFPPRYRIETSDDETFASGVNVLLDRTEFDQINPGTKPQQIDVAKHHSAQFVRFTATRLAPRADDYIFALGELLVMNAKGENVALGKRVTSLDSIQAPVRWQRKNLVDGYYFGKASKEDAEQKINALRDERMKLIKSKVPDQLKVAIKQNETALQETEELIAKLPAQQTVYAGTIHHGSGNFVGTGVDGGKPRTIHVLHRGDILNPRKEVTPGTIPIIENTDWQFELPETHSEDERRIALARWIVRKDNPLTWRSIVNRVWHYHFGRGLVDSPNDFGRMGKLPSHPELLDWLAVEFRDGDQSLKTLHRMIVNSSVYRQSSAHHDQNSAIDSGNVFLWRMNRRRLSAEELRDSVLLVSGKLDLKMYGPGFQDFVIERPEHSPHYEYHKHDPDDPKSHRRSIYRFVVRSQPDPFMTTLDCADSSQSVPKRDETITALQALSLLNNKFTLRMAEHFAQQIETEADETDQQVVLAYRRVTGRSPSDEERNEMTAYAKSFGNANLCRLLFNLNEFVFVD